MNTWCGKLAGVLTAAGLTALACCVPGAAWAHGGSAHAHGQIDWSTWHWDPLTVSSLSAVTLVYSLGVYRLRRRAGPGRGVARWQVWSFVLAMVALVAALLSPIDPMSDELSWVHMVQHMLLMNVAAPLFMIAAPARVMAWGLTHRVRRMYGRARKKLTTYESAWYLLWQPGLLWGLYAVTLWIWHLPVLYEAALRNEVVHIFQHLTFFVASCLFWRVLVDPIARLRVGHGSAVMYLFTTSLHATVLGVFMALAPRVWYPAYIGRTERWYLTALEDQQLAGLIMWMPACMVYAVGAAAFFVLWLQQAEQGRRRHARLEQRLSAGSASPPAPAAESSHA